MASPHQKVSWHSIELCPNGHVLLRFGFTTIHLSPQDFQEFFGSAQGFLKNWERHPDWFDQTVPQHSTAH